MYGEEAKRVSSDIDVLVKREDISRFEEILVHNGYETNPLRFINLSDTYKS